MTDRSVMYCLRVPVFSRSRVILSSQMLWLKGCASSCVAFSFLISVHGYAGQAGGSFFAWLVEAPSRFERIALVPPERL